jgi:hypothetical protein
MKDGAILSILNYPTILLLLLVSLHVELFGKLSWGKHVAFNFLISFLDMIEGRRVKSLQTCFCFLLVFSFSVRDFCIGIFGGAKFNGLFESII